MTSTPPPAIWPTLNYTDAIGSDRVSRHLHSGLKHRSSCQTKKHPNVVEHAQLIFPEGGGIMLGTANR